MWAWTGLVSPVYLTLKNSHVFSISALSPALGFRWYFLEKQVKHPELFQAHFVKACLPGTVTVAGDTVLQGVAF